MKQTHDTWSTYPMHTSFWLFDVCFGSRHYFLDIALRHLYSRQIPFLIHLVWLAYFKRKTGFNFSQRGVFNTHIALSTSWTYAYFQNKRRRALFLNAEIGQLNRLISRSLEHHVRENGSTIYSSLSLAFPKLKVSSSR